jgi:DNA repair photolyase
MTHHTAGNTLPAQKPLKGVTWIDNATILTPTGGFLKDGYTHTLNASSGCAFAGSSCGSYCYAQHNTWITKGRDWGLYGVKRNLREAYQREYDQIKRPRRGTPRPLKIYMSSSTDPYIPQEKFLKQTLALLEEMVERPPDVLVIQTRNPLIQRDLSVIQTLAARCELWVSITCETDMERVPGFPPHASSPRERLEALKTFRQAGVQTQATVSPLMPLADPETFARQLDVACVRLIVDHYLLGDGSQGLRTKRTNFEQMLIEAGFGEWTKLDKLYEIRDLLARVLGPARVLVSAEGFNAVGQVGKPANPSVHDAKTSLGVSRDVQQPVQLRNVYEALRDHQEKNSHNLRLLHEFLPLINQRFYEGKLPLPALSWDTAHPGTLGWYMEKDGLALNHRINLNSMYANRPLAEVLRTLAHELGHEWQLLYGNPSNPHKEDNYHNSQFRRKMQSIGIPCNKRGVSIDMQEPFLSFLKGLGVEIDSVPFTPANDDEEEQKPRPGSRLKPWSCGCTRVWASIRVGVEATCAKCKNAFERQ